MSHRGGEIYDCFKCEVRCEKHVGGQMFWFDRDGNLIKPR